jgi:hypothetical protein
MILLPFLLCSFVSPCQVHRESKALAREFQAAGLLEENIGADSWADIQNIDWAEPHKFS